MKIKKVYLKRLFLFVDIILVFLILLELFLRIFYFATFPATLEDVVNAEVPIKGSNVKLGEIIIPSSHWKIVYELKPNLDVRFYGHPITTNSRGWREQEFSRIKEDNIFRIVGIGDSFMFGYGVDENDRYMDVLEKRLNDENPDYNFETLVFAIPGYNLPMEVEVLEKYGLSYEPDMIIYGYVPNDHCLPNYIINKKDFFSFESYINYYIKKALSDWTVFTTETDDGVPLWVACDTEDKDKKYEAIVGQKAFFMSLERLANISKIREIPVVLFLNWRSACDEFRTPDNILCIDAESEYNSYLGEFSDLVLSEYDTHPSKKGHELLSDALYNGLIHENLVSVE